MNLSASITRAGRHMDPHLYVENLKSWVPSKWLGSTETGSNPGSHTEDTPRDRDAQRPQPILTDWHRMEPG